MIDTEDRRLLTGKEGNMGMEEQEKRGGLSGNDNATERDPKLIQGPRSVSVPEGNKEVDKVIRKETKRE